VSWKLPADGIRARPFDPSSVVPDNDTVDLPTAPLPATAEDPFVARAAAVHRPVPGWIGAVVALPAVIGALLWASGIHDTWIASFALLASLLMSGAAGLAVRRRRVDVRASARGLTIGDAALVPRADIEDAMVLPRPGLRPRVRIGRRGLALPLQVEVLDETEAQRLLQALGLDVAHTSGWPTFARWLWV
jgi:hypothetical protein